MPGLPARPVIERILEHIGVIGGRGRSVGRGGFAAAYGCGCSVIGPRSVTCCGDTATPVSTVSR
jgi:hypothetical protein